MLALGIVLCIIAIIMAAVADKFLPDAWEVRFTEWAMLIFGVFAIVISLIK